MILLRLAVFFNHCLIISSFTIEIIELVDIDIPFHVLYTDSTLSLEQVLTKLLLQDLIAEVALATTISVADRVSEIKI